MRFDANGGGSPMGSVDPPRGSSAVPPLLRRSCQVPYEPCKKLSRAAPGRAAQPRAPGAVPDMPAIGLLSTTRSATANYGRGRD